MPSGTLVSHALHDIFLAEVRQQGWDRSEKSWSELNHLAVADVGCALTKLCYQDRRPDYVLPAGTDVIAHMIGSVIVGEETLGFDVDRPGLHAVVDLPSRPGGSNLARLLRYVDELTVELPCRAIGSPKLVDRIRRRHPHHYLQFRPFAPAGDVVLQRDMNFGSWGELFCAYSDEMIRDLADGIVEDMRTLHADHRQFAPRIRSGREAATLIASSLRDVRVHAMTVDISGHLISVRDHSWNGRRISVEFDAWDDAFRRGLVVQELSFRDEPYFGVDATGLDRADAVAEVHALEADGWIGGLARAIVRAAPQGKAAVLADLAERFETFVTLPVGDAFLHLRLHWHNGEICADTRSDLRMSILNSEVTLYNRTLPETLISGLRGHPFHVVLDHPFRCGSPIASIENRHGNLVIRTEPDLWLVRCRRGRMWPEG